MLLDLVLFLFLKTLFDLGFVEADAFPGGRAAQLPISQHGCDCKQSEVQQFLGLRVCFGFEGGLHEFLDGFSLAYEGFLPLLKEMKLVLEGLSFLLEGGCFQFLQNQPTGIDEVFSRDILLI